MEALSTHIERLDQELRTQLQRIAQIQRQLDEARAALKRLMPVTPEKTESPRQEREH